jgi:hypothetical protein
LGVLAAIHNGRAWTAYHLSDVINIQFTTKLQRTPGRIRQLLFLEGLASSAFSKDQSQTSISLAQLNGPDKTILIIAKQLHLLLIDK